jgi:peptidoglycan/xylan/chitin deacetylase (PgdA/CDA1 family)
MKDKNEEKFFTSIRFYAILVLLSMLTVFGFNLISRQFVFAEPRENAETVINIFKVGFEEARQASITTNQKQLVDENIESSSNKIDNFELKPLKETSQKIQLPVLMYHNIQDDSKLSPGDKIAYGLSVSPEAFERQLQFIQENEYTTITSLDLYKHVYLEEDLPAKPIMLTFDDGFINNYENAFPLLQKYDMKGEFAIITGMVGLGDFMSWPQIKEMAEAGMGFSSHTQYHCYLAPSYESISPIGQEEANCPDFSYGGTLDTLQIKNELLKSRQALEENLDMPVTSLVYPYGKYNPQVVDIAEEAGYRFAFTIQPSISNTLDLQNPLELTRYRVNGQQEPTLRGFFVE